ncbi:MAG TPA: formyltransferase family protein, partial [Arthrobacter sp.]|nr:formyltransferase family protein [Arthrobacter sp.]
MRIVVLVSGTGSNLQAVIDAVTSGELDVELAAVGADRPGTYGVERSAAAGIPT